MEKPASCGRIDDTSDISDFHTAWFRNEFSVLCHHFRNVVYLWIEYKIGETGINRIISHLTYSLVLCSPRISKMRLLVLFNPNVDPYGSGYHVIQSKISIGSGGFIGQGLFSGTQSQLDFYRKIIQILFFCYWWRIRLCRLDFVIFLYFYYYTGR